MVMKKRFTNLGSIIKRSNTAAAEEPPVSDADTPEANAARGVKLFCESGAANSGEEVLHLPTIVEAAVASPAAAAAAAAQIRKFLSKENYSRPHVQYNAIMIIRILADNPGPSFTKNLDKHFADTVKQLLRHGQDPSVAQILRETLDALDREKAYDTNLSALFAMWKKEKELMAKAAKQLGPRTMNAPPWQGSAQAPAGFGHGGGKSSGRGLPPPSELVGRIEEARTSAKLLLQLVQSTPPQELLGNDLIKEFSERCMAAQRSIQGYINCDNPAPDDDTMLTLIETNEQLSLAASKHQRAVLQARRLHGPSPSPPLSNVNSNNSLPPMPAGVAPDNSYAPSNSYAPPSNSYAPAAQPPNNLYAPVPQHPPQQPPRSEAPFLPPVNLASKDKTDLPLPPSLQAGGGNRRRADAEEDDPFADHHSPAYAAAPPGPPPPPPRRTSDPDHVQAGNLGPSTSSPSSYNPGLQSTPSYLGRQESSSNTMTMHGAAPVQRTLSEEEEYARDYPISAGPRTPEQTRRPHRDSDVSPMAERGTVTYRY